MSTRKGNVVFMDDLIHEAEKIAMQVLSDRKNEILKVYQNLNNENSHKMNEIPVFMLDRGSSG